MENLPIYPNAAFAGESEIFIKDKRGMTFVEVLVVVAILIILTLLTVPAFRFFQKELELNSNVEEIIGILRLARSKTLASERGSQWGVYFSTSTIPHQYILFQGSDFSSRTTSSDEVYQLLEGLEISEIILSDLNGTDPPNAPIKEVIFERLTGKTYQPGSISIKSKSSSEVKTIQIENSGKIEIQ